jgi:hypothetical protein
MAAKVSNSDPGTHQHPAEVGLARWPLRSGWCYRALVQNESREVNMGSESTTATVKVVGANGQISLGKQYAGRQVLVEEQEAGVWLVRTAPVVPDNERWLLDPKAATDLRRALAWAAANPPDDAAADDVLNSLGDGET